MDEINTNGWLGWRSFRHVALHDQLYVNLFLGGK